jgi:hypothetical protein
MNKKLGGANLGDLVKDTVTGFKGIVICRSVWLNGCARLTVQPQSMKDGKPIETQCFDELQIEVLKRGVVESENRDAAIPPAPPALVTSHPQQLRRTGGPRPNVAPRP